MRVVVFAGTITAKLNKIITLKDSDYVIAVDLAFDYLLDNNIKVDLVVGDFDSLINKELLKDFKTLKLDPIKDETDTYIAIKEAFKISDEVILIGGIKGPRIEHFIANLYLLDKYPSLVIIDEDSKISLIDKGENIITSKGYISLFAHSNSRITLKGFKYPLDKYNLSKYDPLCISNELTGSVGLIEIDKGSCFLIETKK
ncbi:thiamine diphosphokinase [Haploplasma modicum]|uniref:thiamine diphosphokinase n=1 Tax=Haploplasma modicum TaxID=2150 RepID=UPI00047BE377|nr:thiamine diphosphokinase [Haploplasma modicum]